MFACMVTFGQNRPGLRIQVKPHPLVAPAAFLTVLPAPLADLRSTGHLAEQLARACTRPMHAEVGLDDPESLRSPVRDLLRHGGFRPSGRSKPSSEYLVRAANDGTLRSINDLVDACNLTSLVSGLPISVVDTQRAVAPFALAVVEGEASYVFNASGQEIRLDGLLCLHDAIGPCANPVKDSQRTKTHDQTIETLSVIWGSVANPRQSEQAARWYRSLLASIGAQTIDIELFTATDSSPS
jgi:DNA/RNA-binding domain of Phe-tRNA-synthetase-like protein